MFRQDHHAIGPGQPTADEPASKQPGVGTERVEAGPVDVEHHRCTQPAGHGRVDQVAVEGEPAAGVDVDHVHRAPDDTPGQTHDLTQMPPQRLQQRSALRFDAVGRMTDQLERGGQWSGH